MPIVMDSNSHRMRLAAGMGGVKGKKPPHQGPVKVLDSHYSGMLLAVIQLNFWIQLTTCWDDNKKMRHVRSIHASPNQDIFA